MLSTDVVGQNIGHVRLLVGFYDGESNAIFVADSDYLETEETREVDGVYYPVWPEAEAFTLEFEWEPLMFAISDGRESVVALLEPLRYGVSPEDAIYTVEGIYAYGDGAESRYARLLFRDGLLRQVIGFTSEGDLVAEGVAGAAREILPQSGDTFTVLEKWLDLDEQGSVVDVAREEGGTLQFGDQAFAWEELDAAVGEYVIGIIAEDLDGNSYESYTSVSVE